MHPWEGVDGHLWLRDLVAMLLDQKAEPDKILYALAKPWKYVAEVERYRHETRV